MDMKYEQESLRLTAEAAQTPPDELEGFWAREAEQLTGARPFADYLRRKLREKGMLQQEVFLAADLPERYGYKLLSQEKHTRRRDVILRLCLAARLTPEEAREALTLYGMAPLHGRVKRDAVFLSALGSGLYDVHAVDELMRRHGLAPLLDAAD